MSEEISNPNWSETEKFLASRVKGGAAECAVCKHPERNWLRARDGEGIYLTAIDEKDWVVPAVVMLVCANCGHVRMHSLEFIAREIGH